MMKKSPPTLPSLPTPATHTREIRVTPLHPASTIPLLKKFQLQYKISPKKIELIG
ncbi:hypothetical protein H6G74_10205 [Nostoc spongiaeforme FACHB-130]|uniref:Uncharacterized protein n=1 Tax=Nostoc spongiaeforme FACHB-130 TaxID=1357510 RepID=A0ABR8FTI3_9NOSO|nr:hypothetical protein [Nostoc spongiaeforme FACHB-130]